MTSRFRFTPPRTTQRRLLPADVRGGGVRVAVEGPIGVGKTTLARLLAPRLDAVELLEVVEENPFLPHFYQDIRGYAFQTQIFFLLSRYRQQGAIRLAREQGRSMVSDYMFAKDRLFARMNLDEHELDLYTCAGCARSTSGSSRNTTRRPCSQWTPTKSTSSPRAICARSCGTSTRAR